MKSLIVYATRSGNTRRVAEAIAAGLRHVGPAEVRSVDAVTAESINAVDLVVVGGPTEGRHMTPPMVAFLDRLPHLALAGRAAAAFDTRVDWPRWLSGSAAQDIGNRLARMGARHPIEAESFIVSMKPEIRPDEVDRARTWGTRLAAQLRTISTQPTSVGA